ncbi:uncharacterized protein LOC105189459 isoform X2 [Harpegnathos saltator]|uniref:uncharacterized protein LOC105189459 isoform X2 n=1 Tax=Harpegnathos saltator TaxID=610380 RepID=UPI000DBED340|nr:uncharacterized protein LOC105189459 isoform X2 [Harpegnathos saltator]
MRKTISVLALIAFACDFFSHDVLVHGDLAGKPEAAGRSDGYEHHQDPHGQLDDAEVPRRAAEDRADERGSNEPVGKWRSNGEALEPKWRDGDSVPLLPFSHYRSYSRDDEVDDVEQEDLPEAARRPFKYRYTVNQNRPQGRRLPLPDDDYEPMYHGRDYNPNEDYSRIRRRPPKNPHDPTLFYEETIKNMASNDGKRGRNIVGDLSKDDEKEVTSARYREAFQARPNEYEQEFNDEEYLRPRPRKRRPPQNYEFALANEASSEVNEEATGTTRPPSQLKNTEDQPITQPSDNVRRSENALQLKSLLKMQQEEGSSLSEILQRRNLTLNDLLKGKVDVINALKSRIGEESDEYIEEMSRVMSNSLIKLAATVSPPWRSTQASMSTSEATMTKSATSSISNDSVIRVTVITDNISMKNYDEMSLNETRSRATEEESQGVEKVTQRQYAHDSSWPKATIPPSISITTSTPLPTINSMEYYLNDDGNVEPTSDRGTRLENLDEDEIMEFSDFTDFKKAKSPMTPTWPSSSNEENASQQSSATGVGKARNVESTLSIEQILNPTEQHIELTKDCGDQDDDTDDKEVNRDAVQTIPMSESFAEDYNAFLEAEYQNDAAIDFGENDGRRNTVKADGDANKSTASPEPEKKQVVSSTSEKSESHDKDYSSERRANQLEKSDDRMIQNHQGAISNNRRYEEVVSEIEPEARAEIFELFASGSAGKRLERLLKSRNMSIEELIALRQRGSSRVHLTEVSRLRVPKPKNFQTSSTDDGEIVISLSPTSGPNEQSLSLAETMKEIDANRKNAEVSTSRIKQDIVSYLHDPLLDKDAANTSMSRLLDLVERDKNASRKATFAGEKQARNIDEYGNLEDSRRTVQIVDLLTTFGTMPFTKEIRQFKPEVVSDEERISEVRPTTSHDHANIVLINKKEERIVRSNDTANEFRAGYVEEITREENPDTVDIRTVYDDEIGNSMNDRSVVVGEEKKTLSKMKPSIIASGAILGVTIVVFLAIFIVCRIRQKQKYTYRNTFSRAVFQGPMLAARKLSNSSSLSTVMVNVVATSTTKRPTERMETQEAAEEFDGMDRSDMDNDSLDANDSWETIPDYAK